MSEFSSDILDKKYDALNPEIPDPITAIFIKFYDSFKINFLFFFLR